MNVAVHLKSVDKYHATLECDKPYVRVTIPRGEWRDLGNPETLTVTITAP